jgi:hypothetical protein
VAGATTIAALLVFAWALDTAVDTGEGVLVVTVDARNAPFCLKVPEPFVTEAVIASVENPGSTTVPGSRV